MWTTHLGRRGSTKARTTTRQARLGVEALGDRSLMSAGLAGGTLTVTGTPNHDTVTVSRQYFEGTWWVRVNERVSDGTFLYPARDSWFKQSDVLRIAFDGGAGNDTFTNGTAVPCDAAGGAGNDALTGGTGNDTLRGGTGDDRLVGQAGNDSLDGQTGRDVLQGGAGGDRLYGGDQDDKLFGGSSYDYLYGQAGNDFLDDGGGLNYLDGGTGLDFNARVIALNGATMADVQQGASPTCGCLAAIQSVARTGRDLRTLITYRGVGDTGTDPVYQVRLYIGGTWRMYAVRFNGDLVTRTSPDGSVNTFDAVPVSDTRPGNRGCEQQSWVTILQRAYLQARGVNWGDPGDVTANGRCDPGAVMTALTGVRSIQYDAGLFDSTLDREDRLRIMTAVQANKAVCAGTFDSAGDLSTEQLVPQHAYSVIGCYTRADGMTMFILRNPWNYDGWTDKNGNGRFDGMDGNYSDAVIHVTWDDFKRSIEDYWVNG